MFIYLFIYNIKIQKLIVTKKFHCRRNLQFISYIYIIIIIIKISRNTIKSLSAIIRRIIYFE